MMAAALSTHLAGIQQIVVVAGEGSDSLERAIALRYLPFAITLMVQPDRQRALAATLPFIDGMRPLDGRAAAYICRDFACRAPVAGVDDLEAALNT